MSEESDSEAEGSSPSFSSTFGQLSRLVRLPRYDRAQAKKLADRIVKMGMEEGFNDQQATQILQLALREATYNGKCISSRLASMLVRSIYPTSKQQFSEDFVLTIIGALGPADDAVVDSNTSLAEAHAQDQYPSSADESDQDDSNDRNRQKRRLKVDIGVQAIAVRLLVLLLNPPSIASFQLNATDDETATTDELPTSFLTSKARRTLDKCYDILFHFLDYQTLRPYLCHILSLTTRRKHVRHHRIVKLMSLRNNSPDDSHLQAFITTCSKYYPELYQANTTLQLDRADARAGGIRYPDKKWLFNVQDIWYRTHGQGEPHSDSNGTHGRPRKRRKETNAPPSRYRTNAKTSTARSFAAPLLPSPSVLSVQEGKLLLTEVMTYKELGFAFDRLQMPSHLVCAIAHDMLATAILAQGNNTNVESMIERISDWAISALSEEMNLPASKMLVAQHRRPRSEVSRQKTSSMLLLLGELIERIGACTATMQRWISRLLHVSIWNSLNYEEKSAVLGILETSVPADWRTFSAVTLDPLKVIISTCPAHEAAMIIDALKHLLRRWATVRNWAGNDPKDPQSNEYFGIRRLSPDIDYIETITQTISTVVDYISSLLLRMPHSLELIHSSLGLYESVFTMPFMGLHVFHLPPRYPVNLVSLTPYGSISTLSRLFGVMKQILDLHIDLVEAEDPTYGDEVSLKKSHSPAENRRLFRSEAARDAFNDCSVYLTDLVWRSNAFGKLSEGRIYDLGLPQKFFDRLQERCEERGDQLVKLCSLSHGSLLGPMMEANTNILIGPSKFLIRGPITSFVLKEASKSISLHLSYNRIRDYHLDWLADRHAVGIRDYFHSTISRFRAVHTRGSFRDDSTATEGY